MATMFGENLLENHPKGLENMRCLLLRGHPVAQESLRILLEPSEGHGEPKSKGLSV